MNGFVKHYPSVQAAVTALRRSLTARHAGIRTPAVLERVGPMALCFERIAEVERPTLNDMLQVLKPVHRMPQQGLARFDPFLRIRPRLNRAPPWVQGVAHQLMARDAAMAWAQTAVIHGDFHPGQVICDAEGRLWLVDLDDLALAPPEADLGNLAAWMATQDPAPPPLVLPPQADLDLAAHFRDIALLRRALKLAEKGQTCALDLLTLRA
jgi:hypothetical protein